MPQPGAANKQEKAKLPAPVPAAVPPPAGVNMLPSSDIENPEEEVKRKIDYRADLIEKRGANIIVQIEELNDENINQLGNNLLHRLLKNYGDKSINNIFLKAEEERNFQRLNNAITKLSESKQFEVSNSNMDILRNTLELSAEKKLPVLLKSILEIIKSTDVIDQIFCPLSQEKKLKLKKDLISYFTEVSLKSESLFDQPYLKTIADRKFIENLNLEAPDIQKISDALNQNQSIISIKANIKNINAQRLSPEEKKNSILQEQLKLLKNPTLFAFSLLLNAGKAETIIQETVPLAVKKYNKSLTQLKEKINEYKSNPEKIDLDLFIDNHERSESALRAIITCNKIAKVEIEAEILKIELNPQSIQIILKYYAENKSLSKDLLKQIVSNKIKLDQLKNPDDFFSGIPNLISQRNIANDQLIALLLFTNQKVSNNLENSQSNLFILNKKLQDEVISHIPVKDLVAMFNTVFEKIVSSNDNKEQYNLAKLSRLLLHQISNRGSIHLVDNLNSNIDQLIYNNQIGTDARKEFVKEKINTQSILISKQAIIFLALARAGVPQAIRGLDKIKLELVNHWQKAFDDEKLPLGLKFEIAQGINQILGIQPLATNSQPNISAMQNINKLLPQLYASSLSSEEKFNALGIISRMIEMDYVAMYQIDPNHLYQFFQDQNLNEDIRTRAASILSYNIQTDKHPFELTEKRLEVFRKSLSNPNSNEELQLASLRIYNEIFYKVDWSKQKIEMNHLVEALIEKVFDPNITTAVKEKLLVLLEKDLIIENLRALSNKENNTINKIIDQLKIYPEAVKDVKNNYQLTTACLQVILKIYPENRKNEVLEQTKDLISILYQLSKTPEYDTAEDAIIILTFALQNNFKKEINKFFDEKIKEAEKNKIDTEKWREFKSFLNEIPIPPP